MGIKELTEKLSKELGVEKIEWKYGVIFSYYGSGDKTYFKYKNLIAVQRPLGGNMVCYDCGSDIRVKFDVVKNSSGKIVKDYHPYCEKCEVKKNN